MSAPTSYDTRLIKAKAAATQAAQQEHDVLWHRGTPIEQIPTFKELLAKHMPALPPDGTYTASGNVLRLSNSGGKSFPAKGPGRLPRGVIRLSDYRSEVCEPEPRDSHQAKMFECMDRMFESMLRGPKPPGAA